tara:strand:+ start:223 stop:507 length:285 start_codon:yes stop_codon:yes gene_type:complete
MEKIEYKVGSKKKEIEIIELGWKDYCKSTDIGFKLQNPNGSIFTDMTDFVMLYTGKKDQDMMEWKSSCKNQAEFNDEIALVFAEITKYLTSKKK